MQRIRIVFASALAAIAVALVIGGASARAATGDPSEKHRHCLRVLNRRMMRFLNRRMNRMPDRRRAFTPPIAARNISRSRRRSAQTARANRHSGAGCVADRPHGCGRHGGSTPAETLPPDNAPAPRSWSTVRPCRLRRRTRSMPSILRPTTNMKKRRRRRRPTAPTWRPRRRVQSVLAAPGLPKTPSAAGSASWIAQVMAALGGAIVAGAVAWFLIGPGRCECTARYGITPRASRLSL